MSEKTQICCVLCCDFKPPSKARARDGAHRYLSIDDALCLWCEHCGHVYSGRCADHEEGEISCRS